MPNPPIVLLTDYGPQDHYVAVLKGVILSIHSGARIVDLCHDIEPQNVLRAGLMLSASYAYFPKGAIFVCVVDPGVGTSRKILCAKTPAYTFIGPDNGLLAPVLAGLNHAAVRQITNAEFFFTANPSATFHGRDIMAPVAARLARWDIFDDLGPRVRSFCKLEVPAVRKSRNTAAGEVLFFDRFGNAVTNIRRSDAVGGFWKKAVISVNGAPAGKVRADYQAASGLFALFNSAGLLELAVSSDSAQRRYGLLAGDPVRAESKR